MAPPSSSSSSSASTSASASTSSSHYQSFSFSFYSSAISTNGGPAQKTSFAERRYTDDSGTVLTERVRQLPGQQVPVYEFSEQLPGVGGARSVGSGSGGVGVGVGGWGQGQQPLRVGGMMVGLQNRITDVTDADTEMKMEMGEDDDGHNNTERATTTQRQREMEREMERQYLKRIEEEYAKREGGA